jgi:hypothetical protein
MGLNPARGMDVFVCQRFALCLILCRSGSPSRQSTEIARFRSYFCTGAGLKLKKERQYDFTLI